MFLPRLPSTTVQCFILLVGQGEYTCLSDHCFIRVFIEQETESPLDPKNGANEDHKHTHTHTHTHAHEQFMTD